MTTLPKGDFGIKIDFDKNTPNPERVFMAMSNIITSFKKLDDSLIKSIDKNITPVLMLEDIEAGSIRVWLKQQLLQIDDGDIKKLDWQAIVGSYLVKAKYVVINFLEGKSKITDQKEVKLLQQDLYNLAEETDVNNFPSYAPISLPSLIENIDRVNNALRALTPKDKVTLETPIKDATFNLDFSFVPEEVEAMMTKEQISNTNTMILRVKKPDYLGHSQWEFKYDRRTIFVKILDNNWLTSFQQRKEDVRPGDSLKAVVRTDVRYGFDNAVISTHYEVIEVLGIIRDESFTVEMFDEDE